MNITGQFRNVDNELINVVITNDIEGDDIIIGENGLHFSREPLTIDYSIDDLFTHVIMSKATINLVTKDYLGEKLFAANAKSQEVTVTKGLDVLFHGYVDPNTFNQPYAAGLDEFTINCLDDLSMLQYYNYKLCTPTNYDSYVRNAANVSFLTILDNLLDLTSNSIIYDASKGINSNRTSTLFSDVGMNELMFYGDSYDDVWTQDKVLEEMMKYLNLHIIEYNGNFYIFDWNTISNTENETATWRLITKTSNTDYTVTTATTELTQGVWASNDTNISIAEVYNQLKLKCDIKTQDSLIENLLEKDTLVSPFSGKQLYCTEYISEGSGDDANNAFNAMVHDQNTQYENAKTVDWYLQYVEQPKWNFYINGYNTISTLLETDLTGNYINQWKIPKYLKEHQCIPSIFRMGSVEHKGGAVKDNEPVSQLDMKDFIYISVNGNYDDYESGTQSPTDNTLHSHSPLIEYTGATSGGVFSPVDDKTTNYIVFSGKILLQPIQWESGTQYTTTGNNYSAIKSSSARKTEDVDAKVPYYLNKISTQSIQARNIIYSENNGEGRYYTRKFYNMTNPSDTTISYMNAPSMQPWTKDKNMGGLEYDYTAIGDGSYEEVDKFSKIPVLECELIIGDKRLIETNIDEYGNSTFEWVTLGQEPTATYVDENGITQTYTVETFSLGFNPKLNEYIIGTENNIQNTISYQMNINATGTAIPIKRSDRVSGSVHFKIIGLINTTWNQITRRHPSFWRHTKWTENVRFILAHTENVIISGFEAKIYSDNSLNDNVGKKKDLVYCSAETDNYITTKDDIEFKFMTQLTSDECVEKGLSTSVNLNSVTNELASGTSSLDLLITSLYDATITETAKAEELYINEYYERYRLPKTILETTLHDNGIMFNDIYISNSLNKNYFPIGMSRNIRMKTNTIKMFEI